MAKDKKPHAERPDGIEVMAMKKGDQRLLEGKKAAQRTLSVFLDLCSRHRNTPGSLMLVKVGVPDGENTLFLWYSFDGAEDGKLFVSHDSIPEHLRDLEKIKVQKDDIEDWMVVHQGQLTGGWSIRVQRSMLPEEDKAGFDKSLGVSDYRENNF